MQLDGLLNQLRSLDEAISNIAEKLSSRNNANAIDHFTEVDTRLQSLAEQVIHSSGKSRGLGFMCLHQVVQLIGGEHARVTQTERKVADLTDSYSRVDQESKALREQLMRQQQHTSLQIEEIFDSIQVRGYFKIYILLGRMPNPSDTSQSRQQDTVAKTTSRQFTRTSTILEIPAQTKRKAFRSKGSFCSEN